MTIHRHCLILLCRLGFWKKSFEVNRHFNGAILDIRILEHTLNSIFQHFAQVGTGDEAPVDCVVERHNVEYILTSNNPLCMTTMLHIV